MPELTKRQRDALVMGKSLCVTAGAGTGKTFILSQRYQLLLSYWRERRGSVSVSNILALTFTEKAATEMRERIRSDIRNLAEKAESEEEYQFWAGILDELFRASITTFHGFCSTVLREFALDAGVVPGFEILDVMEKHVLTTTLIKNVFVRPPESLYQDASLLCADLTVPEAVVAELLPQYPEFSDRFPKTLEEEEDCVAQWRGQMLSAVRKQQEMFFADGMAAAAIADLIDLAHCYGEGDDSGVKYLRKILPALQQFAPDAKEETFYAAVSLVQEANGASTGARLGSRSVFGTDLARLRKAFADFRRAVDAVPKGWGRIPRADDAFTRESVRVIAALGRVTREVFRQYQRQKQQRGVLDFEDLIRMTALLVKNPAVQQVLRRRFTYILVDEVQDTDPAQSAIIWQILGSLTPSNDAIFVVGDPKQSIYAFRNADICGVNAMQKRICMGCGTEPVALDVSFRSTKEILGIVNTLFSRLFAETATEWDVSYDPILVSGSRIDDVGTIRILETVPDGVVSDALLEARTIAAKIREMIDAGIEIRDACGMRCVRFGDVAILLETRNSQVMIERALQESKIPYNIYKSQGFYRSQEVADMTLLLSVVAGISDDIALYGVLRSPYFGISDAELCIAGSGSYYGRISRHAKENPASRLAPALAQLRRWQGFAMREPVPELLRRILRESGMHAVYGGVPTGRFILANLEKLIGLARVQTRKHAMPLPEFVRMLETGAGEMIEEEEAQIDLLDENAVQIMTVHASKGLEFPVVVLANLEKNKSSPGTGLVLDKKFGVGLSIRMHGMGEQASDTFVKMFTREVREAKEIAEKKRLFYVAMTRARDHLVLSYVKGKCFPPKNTRAAWIAAYLLPKERGPSCTVTTDDGLCVEIPIVCIRPAVPDGDTSAPEEDPQGNGISPVR
ncbi:MAG: UvrD-helicase domain-containing protein [Methanocalculaceae archaeon]|nr:UvrD-helicase domain-containing protein [Methanocalculaceae archaeon]